MPEPAWKQDDASRFDGYTRALRVFGVEEGRRFSENVQYIYRKQLEEAEIIVVNKMDEDAILQSVAWLRNRAATG